MDTGAALGGTGLFLSIMGIVYSAINHKHIKSRCCGKEYDMSVDIGTTSSANIKTPTTEAIGQEKVDENVKRHYGRKVAPSP